MASHLMAVDIIFQKNKCLTDPNHYKDSKMTIFHICDMIKGNESDVGNIDFKLQAKRGDKFLWLTLFLNVKKCSYLCNQVSD